MKKEACPRLIIICGPTASGKSALALRLAQQLDAEIINADSMQVYKLMNIGTAKPAPEHLAAVRHHLIDIVRPDEPFSAANFMEAADCAIKEIAARGKRVIVVGGTGLYIRALLQGLVDSPSGAGEIRSRLQQEAREIGNQAMLEKLRNVDPDSANQMHSNNLVRIIRALEVYELTGIPLSRSQQEHRFSQERYEAIKIGVKRDRKALYAAIDARVDTMMSEGLLEEVQALLKAGYSPEAKSMRGIGYKELTAFLAGKYSLHEAVELIKRDTRRYAKRQLTWFNADKSLIWLEYPEDFATIFYHAFNFMNIQEDSAHGKSTI
ncbi:MAG: tRNA (adenosine(37)-N6)-dimethylallyltransferase MiaA [Geobacteraceae bacterium GWC2_48_7]|nr:MAG: tRNA (adenosine(37)-N6)-dimethylallyltransferase MiaA [Geobacteraceae bacterium GWC2_48_7]